MARSREELNLIITAKDRASKEVRGFQTNLKSLAKTAAATVGGFAAFRTVQNILSTVVKSAADLEKTMVSLEAVTQATGRSMANVTAAMKTQIGGLASELSIAEGFLKGLTTELNVEQINNLTTAIKDASIAMGEDFNTQLPLIIKAIKQLNPAILDNIGVTVRLDRINKRITKTYGITVDQITEAMQQQQIYNEVLQQTAKFKGQEERFLETTAGQWAQIETNLSDTATTLGKYVLPGIKNVSAELNNLTQFLLGSSRAQEKQTEETEDYADALSTLNTELDSGTISLHEYRDAFMELTEESLRSERRAEQNAKGFSVLENRLSNALEAVRAGAIDLKEFRERAEEAQRVVGFKVSSPTDNRKEMRQQLRDVVTEYEIAAKQAVREWNRAILSGEDNKLVSDEALQKTQFDVEGYFNRNRIQINAALRLFDPASEPEKELEQEALSDAQKLAEQEGRIALENAREVANSRMTIHQQSLTEMSNAEQIFHSEMANIADSGVSRIADAFATGRESLQDVFVGIAQDFQRLVIEQILKMLIIQLIPGLGSFFGPTIFDALSDGGGGTGAAQSTAPVPLPKQVSNSISAATRSGAMTIYNPTSDIRFGGSSVFAN